MISGFVALLFRSVGVLLCVAGTHLTWKERLFCVIAYLPKAMLMCHKVTHKNLIDSSPLFRYYLTHTPCNFFVKPIDSDTSEEI